MRGKGSGHSVGNLSVVQDRTTTGRAPDEVDSSSTGELEVIAAAGGLVATERDRRRRPNIQAEHRLPGPGAPTEQCLIEGHIRGPVCRGGHEQPGCSGETRPVVPSGA